MRSLTRPDISIPTLDDTGSAGKKRIAHREKFATDGPPKKFPDDWNNADVRGLLHAMQAHVCAYCGLEECTLDVEHFRPKGAVYGDDSSEGYWWLAYEASNYFFGCPACNQKRKGMKFPLHDGSSRVSYATRDELHDERRVLFDPVEDGGLEQWFQIEWSDPSCSILPSASLPESDTLRVEEVIDFFNLNMDSTVRRRRSQAFENAARAADKKQWDEVRRMAMRHREHSFVARFVLVKLNQPLPAPEEELADLAELLWSDLREQIKWIVDLRNRNKVPNQQDLRQMASYAWALVILQRQSTATASVVGDFLTAQLTNESNFEIRDQIVQVFRKLSAN